jgi:hypothetical protein
MEGLVTQLMIISCVQKETIACNHMQARLGFLKGTSDFQASAEKNPRKIK